MRARVTQRFHDLGLEDLESMKGAELLLGMADCVPEERLVEVFSQFDLEQIVTKRMLAKVYMSLAGVPEKVIFSDGFIPPRDVSADDGDAGILLLASVPYIISEDGKDPRQAILDRVWPTGFHLMGGALYYADEEGKLTRNDSIGVLNFDSDGRQTSGDAELDLMVRERIAGFVEEAPAATMEELLMKAFEYARDNIYYVNRGEKQWGEVGWENEEAKGGHDSGFSIYLPKDILTIKNDGTDLYLVAVREDGGISGKMLPEIE